MINCVEDCSQVVILAGGKGTRLAAVSGGLPKALVSIGGRSVLQRQIDLACRHGVKKVLLLLGHAASEIIDHVKSLAICGLTVEWMIENEPLGNGGALLKAGDRLDSRFLVFFADQVMEFDVGRFVRHHAVAGNAVTVFVHPNDHPYDSDLLSVDDMGRVIALHRPPHSAESPARNLVNAATYIVEKKALARIADAPIPARSDIARDILPLMIKTGVRVGAYRSREYVKDMGTPDRLRAVELDLQTGAVSRRSAVHAMPAILLDRDGTVNVEVGRITRPRDIELLPGIGEAINRAHRAGFLVAIVTNQPVVARGDVTQAQLEVIHGRMEMLLAESRAYVDGIYVCPHHPERGFPGEVPELKFECQCRKPAVGLIEQAKSELNIDMTMSWMIGDSACDIECATAAGLIPVLVDTGHAVADSQFATSMALRFSNAPEAIAFITDRFSGVWQTCCDVASRTNLGQNVVVRGTAGRETSNLAKLMGVAISRRGLPVRLQLARECVSPDHQNFVTITIDQFPVVEPEVFISPAAV